MRRPSIRSFFSFPCPSYTLHPPTQSLLYSTPMAFLAFRSLIRPASRLISPAFRLSASPPDLRLLPRTSPLPWIPPSTAFHSLTDTRYPKRRPAYNYRRKRASLRPPGPYAWVKCEPGQPILPNQPNEGSVKRRNEKKRINQHRAFIMSEKRKRKALIQEAKRKKIMKRVERKMAAVAREKAWQERLVELKRIEAEKKAAMA